MDPAKLKVVELREQLSKRGLDTKGNKPVLVERLRKALKEESDSQPQDKSNTDMQDAPAQDTVQPPKTPARSSRSSSMTPTKVATRSTPRTPNRSTPTKAQYRDKSPDILPTIEESAPKEDSQEINQDVLSSEENRTSPEKETVQSKDDTPIVKTPQKIVEDRAEMDNAQPVESSVNVAKSPKKLYESPKKVEASPVRTAESPRKPIESPEKPLESPRKEETSPDKMESSKETCVQEEKPQESSKTEVKEETVICEEPEECTGNVEENVKPTLDNSKLDYEAEENRKESVKTDESNEDVRSHKQNVEMDDNAQRCNISETENSTNIPVNDQLTCVDEKIDDSDIKHEEDTSDVMKKQDVKDEMDVDCRIDSNDVSNEDQDTEMTEVKPDKEIKTDAQDSEKRDRNDRKRKRSPSPVEERKMSPIPAKVENEPEIDDSSVILSWYDSDLNLDINKDGFVSATPMHTDGFCYIWAGSRASYGFTCGKVYYEAKIIEHCSVKVQDAQQSHALRLGWSVPETSMQLGEEKHSYAYDSTGKKATDNEFTDYGPQFSKDDVVGCYLDSCSDNIMLSYTLNGKDLGTAFSISKDELGNRPLFPHILSKNCSFACNFGQEETPWSENVLEGYVPVGKVDLSNRIPGPRRPEKKEDCEVIMVCGLPASGKTHWARKRADECPEKKYNILGISNLVDKMKEMGKPYKEIFQGRWDTLIDKCTHSLNKLIEIASSRRRNYILDQTNVYSSVQRRKMRNFSGYQRKAVVIVPKDEEYKSRFSKHEDIDGKKVSDSTLMEMKASFSAPQVGEYFDNVEWVELNKEEGNKLIERYNKEGKEAGYTQQQHQSSKRPRFDRTESNRDNRDIRSNRDNRDNRDHRDRKMNYDKSRNSSWRGGWRDRGPQRGGGHMRHGSSYGPPAIWRGRGPVPPPHRGIDRRGGSGDRRPMNDRNRSMSRGGWGPMSSSYQGQQSNWNQGGNWSGSQPQQSWGQGSSGGGWGQQQQQQQWSSGSGSSSSGNWKTYGQGSYTQQSNYNQGYGNGNWNSWNQQYYNQQQYWQQHPSGQTTAGSQSLSKQ